MINLKDKLTILISVKIDHNDRLRNIRTTLNYLKHLFDVNIIISEQDTSSKLKDTCEEFKCNHIFVDTDNFFNRQRGVNLAAKQANTPVIAHYDADILLRPQQIVGATQYILDDRAQMVYPYNGYFYDVPEKYFEIINKNKDLTQIDLNECKLFNKHSVGGAVFFDRDHYWKCGGANENFKGVGYEDNEINIRFNNLGTKVARCEWPLWHLTHHRGDTSYNYNPHIECNKELCMQIAYMSIDKLKEHIKTWDWCK